MKSEKSFVATPRCSLHLPAPGGRCARSSRLSCTSARPQQLEWSWKICDLMSNKVALCRVFCDRRGERAGSEWPRSALCRRSLLCGPSGAPTANTSSSIATYLRVKINHVLWIARFPGGPRVAQGGLHLRSSAAVDARAAGRLHVKMEEPDTELLEDVSNSEAYRVRHAGEQCAKQRRYMQQTATPVPANWSLQPRLQCNGIACEMVHVAFLRRHALEHVWY